MIKQGEQLSLFNAPPQRDPWQHAPERWLADDSRGPVVYHAGFQSRLPSVDEAGRHTPIQKDESTGRYRTEWGDAEGMHFGSQLAAHERSNVENLRVENWRPHGHTARIPQERISHDVPLSDTQANFSDEATHAVAHGRAVPYLNESEDAGSISYRVRAEQVRTWGEDVMADPHAHPAMKAAAAAGYNPTVDYSSRRSELEALADTPQKALWDYEVAHYPQGRYSVNGGQVVSYHQFAGPAGQDALNRNRQVTKPGAPYNHYHVTAAGAVDRERREFSKPFVPTPATMRKTGVRT